MKRVLWFMMVVAILSLAGCRGQEAPATPQQPAAPAAPQPAAPVATTVPQAPQQPATPLPAAPAPTAVQVTVAPVATPTAVAPVARPAPTAVTGPKSGGTLRVVSQASIKSLDPGFSTSYVTWAPSMGHIFEGLFTQDAKYNPQPMLVDKWSVSQDGITYSFTIREGVTFHNGQALTTDDVIPSIRRIMPNTAAGELIKKFLAENGMVKQDNLTFTMKQKEPFPALLDAFAQVIVGHVLVYTKEAAAIPRTEDVGEHNLVGTGPYKLARWEVGNRVTLERFPNYKSRTEPASNQAGAKKAYLDKIEWLEIPNEETKMAGLKTAEWDFVDGIGLDFVSSVKSDPNLSYSIYPGHMWYFGFNVSEPPIDKVKIRLAIQAAMDGEAMLRTLGPEGTWKLCGSIYGCGTPYESNAGVAEHYNVNDVAKAKQLLQEAGYAGETITILHPTDYGTITPVGPVIKARLEEIGMKVDMPAMDWATATSKRLGGKGWHIFTSWGIMSGRQNPAVSFLLSAGGKGTGFGYYNAKLEEQHLAFLRSQDPAEKKRIADEMQLTWFQDPPHVYSGIFFMHSPYRKWVKGFPPEYQVWPSYANVWIEK
jgi:peptide/nickel transport system substrate-binding protein